MLYIIKEEGTDYIKIGYTKEDPERRKTELQTGNPRKLSVLATREGELLDEFRLHEQLVRFKAKGGSEWFCVPSSELDKLTRKWDLPEKVEIPEDYYEERHGNIVREKSITSVIYNEIEVIRHGNVRRI